ncbi:MAG: recombinase family protein, partial [Glaciihabitans sp.]|nr:recombinase family protein [Glaciihabitans sp.]
VHFHYLKGVLYCGECLQAGRRSRLLYSQNTGNGGMYEYFICTAKQRRLCSTPAIRVEQVEAHIVRAMAAERFDGQAIDDMTMLIREAVHDLLAADRDAKAQLRQQLAKLETQEERLIDLAATGAVSVPKLRAKTEQTTLQKEAVKEKLELTGDRLKYGAEKAMAYLELLREPGELYQGASDAVRRDLLAAFFNRLIVYVEDDRIRVESDRNRVNTAIRDLHAATGSTEARRSSMKTENPRDQAGSSVVEKSRTSSFDRGLSKNHLAGVPGFEPRTKESESSVLPVTPYPTEPGRSRDRLVTLTYRDASPKTRRGCGPATGRTPCGGIRFVASVSSSDGA